LGDEISAESQRCSESRGGGGEEAAAIEQGQPPDVSTTEGAMLRLGARILKGELLNKEKPLFRVVVRSGSRLRGSAFRDNPAGEDRV
jgi:hypothetical protein